MLVGLVIILKYVSVRVIVIGVVVLVNNCVFRVLLLKVLSSQTSSRVLDVNDVLETALSTCGSNSISDDYGIVDWFNDMFERGYLEKYGVDSGKFIIIRDIYVVN